MSKQQVDDFFQQYVFLFMFSDIRREIDLAESGRNAGNLLAASGLLCYTEVLGGIKLQNFPIPGKKVRDKDKFDAFYETLGPCYLAFGKTTNVYNVFRCGMTHEYLVKRNCEIAMLRDKEPCGLGRGPNGRYYFVLEHYFDDFEVACRTLHQLVMALPNPTLLK